VKSYIYSDFSAKDALTMEVDGVGNLEIIQFSSSWAANEIPTAAVMLAVGRETRAGKTAGIHAAAKKLKQMQKARVYFKPTGEYDRQTNWPGTRAKIFEGYFTGFAYRKVHGKVQVIANLIHWLAALGFSSALTKTGHVSNPTQLNAAAVLASPTVVGAGEGLYISALVPARLCANKVTQDLWSGIKDVFVALASVEAMTCGPQQECGGNGVFTKNDVALEALQRIEGPSESSAKAYEFGVPLKLETENIPTIADAVALAIGTETVESYSATTFWDKMVSQLFPYFGMAIVPMVESAIVVADTPALAGVMWKEIRADDYASYDLSRESHRPLRAVGVVAGYASATGAGKEEAPEAAAGEEQIVIGGCYVEESVAPGDGMIMYVAAPGWLQTLFVQPNYIGGTTGLNGEKPSKTSTTPVDPPQPDMQRRGTIGVEANALYERFAREVFVNQMLRGHTGAISGRLRFDIAPLSIVKINATSEKFLGRGQDDLAESIYGCVQRVTIGIDAESGMAGTTFVLTHVRTETENTESRTSVDEHPLFGNSIHGGGKHGSPLQKEFDFPEPEFFAGDGPVAPGDVA
jgi:hypothetical protein